MRIINRCQWVACSRVRAPWQHYFCLRRNCRDVGNCAALASNALSDNVQYGNYSTAAYRFPDLLCSVTVI